MSSERLTRVHLDRIRRLDPELGAFVTWSTQAALETALQADADLAAGVDRGPLHGIPVAVKDILATADAPTTGQSHALDPAEYSGRDAAAVAALRAAGAVILGKTSLSELAIGLPEADERFPLPRNPWDLRRWAGGSSAGTASGLAAGLFLGGLGTDTGGSIRIPASFCGITGLKPTRGAVPGEGCVPLAPSLDTVGPMARTARDCALLLDAISGSSHATRLDGSAGGLRIGVDRRHLREAQGVDGAAVEAFDAAVAAFAAAGAPIVETEVPGYELAASATSIVIASEALRSHRARLRERWLELGRSTRLRIAAGAFYTDADYARARALLERAARSTATLFESFDVLVTLTTGTGAWLLGDLALDAPAVSPFFTRIWSGLGYPALSVPVGYDGAGLPLGLQIIGPPGADGTVLRAGDAYQATTGWHLCRPPFGA